MEQEIEVADERGFLGIMIRFAILAGLLFVAAKFLNDKRNQYADLTESEARSKFVETVGPRVGDDTANEIADQVIPKLKDRGLVKADPVEEAANEVKKAADDLVDAADDATKEVADAAKDAADKASDQVSDAVDSVVKD